MILETFISRLNWRQILIHFVAFWFFIYAFETLSYLYNPKLIDILKQSKGQLTDSVMLDNNIALSDEVYFILWTGLAGLVGLVMAFLISLIISARKHWFWLNAFIAFTLTFLLYRFDLLGWTYVNRFFWFAGRQFNNVTIEFLVNGLILLAIGIFVFFSKRPNQFIENKSVTAY